MRGGITEFKWFSSKKLNRLEKFFEFWSLISNIGRFSMRSGGREIVLQIG